MITDDNYEIALTLLPERYKNIRCIVQAQLKKIRTQASMKSESGLGLSEILETTNEPLRALNYLGEPADPWDSLLFVWITKKLNNQSKQQWQLGHPCTDLLKRKNLVNFLDFRGGVLELDNVKELSQAQSSNTHNSKKNQRFHFFSTISVFDESCSESYKIHACPQFENVSVSERMKFTRSKQSCLKCLQTGYSISACSSRCNCRVCKMKHHTLLQRDKN